MFYSQFILAKKGPLGTIWIAAHLERKLRKNQVADTDIGVSVDSILFPEVPIALRLSSHLLLGVVRIYSRKVNYLFDDCSEALLKIKQAFRSTAVDLPPEESTAPYHSITLPETFDLDDFELPDSDFLQGNYVDHHVSTREQITLQDTMEGVVYSTSQFGLDERFGDGDASQIGLDLEEVLLTDRASTVEHDDIIASPLVSQQKDEKKEEIGDLPTAAEVCEYAQGPSTPRLEEPNVFGSQVDQINNEVDYHNSVHLVSMKTTEKESSGHEGENNVIDCSLQDNGEHVAANLHHEDNDCVMVEVDSKREEQEHLACMVEMKDQENLIANEHCLTSPLMDSSNKVCPTTISPECAGGMINASDKPEKEEDLMNNEPVVAPVDQTVTNGVSGGVSVDETVAPPGACHVISDQEDPSCKLLSNVDGSRGPESDGHLEDDNSLSKNEVPNDIEISKNEVQPCPVDEAPVSNFRSPLGSLGRPEVVDIEAHPSQELKEAETSNHVSHDAVQPTDTHLRPCTSYMCQPSFPSIEGETFNETGALDPGLVYHETTEQSVCKGKPDVEKSDLQVGSPISSNKVESINRSTASEMPEPEKLLSLAHQHDGEANDLLMESTPDIQGISEGHPGATGLKYISGKKRSYTESTLTVQSLDMVESYGGTQSKRTAESLPDDDDLLSSILVGRRSSVLKIKPSPAAPEMASRKRARSTPRTSAIKRKVLMDDMMVLHGDTIRQQLTNTEDIRRMRKKAPCTRREILMIQRQFLEDEIFHEPIFTDLSANLTILRDETLNLTGIEVSDYDLDSYCMEKANDQDSYSRTNTEIHGMEGNNEPTIVPLQEDAEVQPTEIPAFSENHPSEVSMGSRDIDAHGNANIVSHLKELDNSQNTEMNNAGENVKESEVENFSVCPHEPSSLTEVFDNDLHMTNDLVASPPLIDKTIDPIHTNILSMPTPHNLNTFPILEDGFVEDQRNGSGAGATEIAEHSMELRTQVQSDGLEANDLHTSLASGPKENDEYTDNQTSFGGDLPIEENGNLGLKEDQMCDDKDALSGCQSGENIKVDCLHSETLVLDEKESSLKDAENPLYQEAGLQSTICPEISVMSPFADQNDENNTVADDTGFLNVGDDEIVEDDDDFMPCAEGTQFENSGWSSRTRAVAKYLQNLFDKEDLHGRQDLHLDKLLAGKTRKEASRMFFETLVLKTRDYVHVEQTKPFASINLKPRMKLMKSDF